ncbi:MAG TPA: mannitol-1-phosphate 5-dehydrogenase [Anaerolineae bacterium]|nr:mannitol-1-phosphate 5-dehydrogenase [Anaerolineae bacterium]
MSKKAIVFGAGNIGRGFIGQLLSESGYELTFVDVDRTLLATLNARQRYSIRLVTNDSVETVTVGPVRGLQAEDREAVAQAVAEATLGATAVGARVLPLVAPNLAAGVARRAEQGLDRPLNLIICENLKNAAQSLQALVKAHLSPADQAYLDRQVGFVDTVIARMIPPISPELRAQDPSLIIVEPYKELPVDAAGFIGPPPAVVGLTPFSPFSFYTERKLYIHNAGHAVLGYLGYQRGYELGYEALADAGIAAAVRGAMDESRRALETKYGLPAGTLNPHVDDLLHRFANRALGDTVFRLGRDPLRKLGPEDRLIGAALNALAVGVKPDYLVAGIVAALRFDHPADPLALELQARLAQEGLTSVLLSVCGLTPESTLGRLIRAGFP